MRVLVVEDRTEIRGLISVSLRQAPAPAERVAEAADGRAALALLEREPFDLVISDVEMPGMDGRALLHEIRARPQLAHLRVVLIGGSLGESGTRALQELGADAVLHKPFGLADLRAAIAAALAPRPQGSS